MVQLVPVFSLASEEMMFKQLSKQIGLPHPQYFEPYRS